MPTWIQPRPCVTWATNHSEWWKAFGAAFQLLRSTRHTPIEVWNSGEEREHGMSMQNWLLRGVGVLALALGACSSISGAPPKGADDAPPADELAAMKEVGKKAGGLIVWSSSREENHDLYTMKTDGSDVKQITKGDQVDWFPRFSPDGSKVLFCRSKSGWVSERDANNSDKWDLYTVPTEGGEPEKVIANA